MSASDPNTKFEALSGNPSFSHPKGNETLGRRDNASLARGFAGSPILTNRYTITNASQVFQQYAGENLQFVEYRRDFKPDGSAGVEYQDVRDKDATPTGAAGLPATPYSPNVASPKVPSGTIFVGASQITATVSGIDPVVLVAKSIELNPINTNYKNIDSLYHNNDVGGVRRFTLGIGSSIGQTRAAAGTTR